MSPPDHLRTRCNVSDRSFGHVGPAIGLAVNLLTLARNVVVTLLIPSGMYDAARPVLMRYDPDPSRLHVVFVNIDATPLSDAKDAAAAPPHQAFLQSSELSSNSQASAPGVRDPYTAGAFTNLPKAEAQRETAVEALSAAYSRLLNLQPLVDAVTQTSIPAFDVPPHVAIIDVTIAAGAIAVLPELNVVANVHVKLLCFSPLSAQWAMWSLVQTYDGECPGYMERCRRIMAVSDEQRHEAYRNWIGENEDAIRVLGLPPTCEFAPHVLSACGLRIVCVGLARCR